MSIERCNGCQNTRWRIQASCEGLIDEASTRKQRSPMKGIHETHFEKSDLEPSKPIGTGCVCKRRIPNNLPKLYQYRTLFGHLQRRGCSNWQGCCPSWANPSTREKRIDRERRFHRLARSSMSVLQQGRPRKRKRTRIEPKNHLISSSGNSIFWATRKCPFQHQTTPNQHRSSTRHFQFISILVLRNG